MAIPPKDREMKSEVEKANDKRVSSGSLAWRGAEIPSLYGIRGVAAMAVVLSHIGIAASNAAFAVICFFVLSGFLITHLLLKEFDKTSDVSLRRFYLRRALRIFPAFYGYATFYVVGRMIMGLHIDWSSLIACLTYTGNYFSAFGGQPLETMVHTWSLAVEEQFYLLWPVIFWAFAGNRVKLMRGLVVAILAIWAYRWFAVWHNFNGTYVYGAFETRADALAIGCLLAIANRENRIPRWLIDRKWIGPLALLIVCVVSATQVNGPRYAWAIVALAFAGILIQSVAHGRSPWYRWLESRPMRALGLISYSLYLYHPFANRLPSALKVMPVEIAFSIALATASYLIVERPFLALKDRMPREGQSVLPSGERVA
jgi:peptidoglycan/LPS O-acetylase OafA/YrhL